MAPPTQENLEFIGLLIARSAILVSPLVIFLALPPFYSGFWVQVEGAMPWLHWIAALGALGCGLAAAAGSGCAAAALRHPLVLLPAAVAGLSLVLLPAATVPALSILGAPEHGFGALAFLDLAALTAAAFVTAPHPIWRRALIGVAVATVAAAFGLDYLFRADRSWVPFFFGDYLAFYAVFVFAIAAVLASGRARLLVLTSIILVALVLLSSNRAAILAIVGATAVVLLTPRRLPRRYLVALCVVFPIAVGVAIVLVGPAWREPFREMMAASLGISPLANIIADSWASLWSRAMLVIVGGQLLIDSPWRALSGLGWGHYNEALLANLPVVEGRFHEYIGTSRVYWDAIRRADFHSHNQYFEALLSNGMLGAALVLAYGAAIVATAAAVRRRLTLFVVLTLGTLQSFWFQMPHTLPLMALGAVMLAAHTPVPMGSPSTRVQSGIALVAALMLTAGGGAAFVASSNARTALTEIRATEGARFEGLGFSAGLREIYEASLLQTAYAQLGAARSERGVISERDLDSLNVLLESVDKDDSPSSLKLLISTVNVVSGLVFRFPEYEARFGSLDRLYTRSVDDLIARAPRRSDIAIPFFNYLLATGRERESWDLAARILLVNRKDPAALWFSGIVLLGRAETAPQGMQNLKRSLDYGIREQMPVPQELLDAIQE